MKKKNPGGFTLIELIVVIAILGVLAGILIPTMLSYVRNSRISKANANAKQVHNAISAAITDMAVSQSKFVASGSSDEVVAISMREKGSANSIPYTISGKYSGTDGYDLDLTAYVGENFTGSGVGIINPEAFAVKYAFWSDEASQESALTQKALEGIYSEATQKADAKNGIIYGCYPLMLS